MKKKDFVGIDISKDHIDCALLNAESPRSFKDKKFSNTLEGFESMEEWLLKNDIDIKKCLFCMEHTGTYGLLLFAWLSQKEFDFCVEPALKIKRSLGLTRGKDDKIDARRIADYALTHVNKLKLFSFPSEQIYYIKQLLTYREQLVRNRTSFKNSIKNHEQYERITKRQTITDDIRAFIEEHNSRIKQVEKQIIETINSDQELKKNFLLATSVKGIGLVIGAFMLVTTNNFSGFEDGRQYASYSGVAPYEHTSGSSVRGKTKVSHLANKTIKTMLSRGANSASKWDPELRAYFIRKQAEGKDYKVIMNAISCKLIGRVFSVVKRKTPYVITYQQKVA
ncbi:MAG TPA: IS110 family transposase [Bacteroidales bacterium]|nr:IS110 family transposase [Bacteroidales bacterium]